jgi:hypothetical protein
VHPSGRLLPVEALQEKVRALYEHHVERGDYAQMALAPPAGGGYISVVVATDQVCALSSLLLP